MVDSMQGGSEELNTLDLLKRKTCTADQVLDMAEQNPKYKELLVKALILAVSGFMQLQNRKKLEESRDAIKIRGWGIDATATLNNRVQQKGSDALREFGDTQLLAIDVIIGAENVASFFASAIDGGSQLQSAVIGQDWHKQIEELLLQ